MQLNPRTPPLKPDADARISVIIPLYNHEKYIEAALGSVFAQSLRPDEIIVVDDGSVDGSAEKVRRLCKDHPEIIFWSWPNQGAHHTLNAAMLRATGDFVAILNSDDCFHPERLAACLAFAQANPRTDVVATGMAFIDGRGDDVASPWYESAVAFFKQEGNLSLGLFNANFLVTTSNLFIRRSIFDSIGYFAPLRYTHDLEFCLRLILGKRQIHFLDRPLLSYRLHDANTIAENKAREDVERAAVFAFFLYRLELQDGSSKDWRSWLERYVAILGRQDLLEIVENFLTTLDAGPRKSGKIVTDALSEEFLILLSRLGADWVAHGAENPLLAQFVAARNDYLQSKENAGGDPKLVGELKTNIKWLTEQRDAWQKTSEDNAESFNQALEAMRTEISWLTEQRNAWQKISEEERKSFNQALDEMRSGNAWLSEQRDAWQQTSEENTKSYSQALEEIRVGNVWLSDQRDAWKRTTEIHEEHSKSLEHALEEMRAGNTWLLGQRDAWELAAATSGEEVARCHAALHGLLSSRLFRLLVRAKLLELRHAPPGSAASG
ncbi:MAG: glycosyltransferase [Proteobacteria bacterium]|nr:glycosyltransferase [Pseudomonadota bacterium]